MSGTPAQPTIIMEPVDPPRSTGGQSGTGNTANIKGAFRVTFQGFTEGQQISLSFYEINESLSANDHGQNTLLGTVTGKIALFTDGSTGPVYTVTPDSSPQQTTGHNLVSFSFPIAQGHDVTTFVFNIQPSANAMRNEGDYWEIQAQIADPSVVSPTFNVARVMRALPVRTANPLATYDWHAGHDLVLYHNASTDSSGAGGAFADLANAISQAKSFIFIADWSFHPYMRLNDNNGADKTIGKILVDKANSNPNILIAIHTWDHTNMGAKDDENDNGNHLLDDIAGGTRPSNLLWRASSRTGVGYSHHQKFVVLDCPAASDSSRSEIKVFYGGLDLTKGRFDWPDHPIINTGSATEFSRQIVGTKYAMIGSDDPQNYDDWYNAEFNGPAPLGDTSLPREPWHDHYAQITGPSAWDVVREFVGRWNKDPAINPTWGQNSKAAINQVNQKFQSLWQKNGNTFKFVLPFEPRQGNWTAQLYRSIMKEHWGGPDTTIVSPMKPQGELLWTIQNPTYERSIQDAYIRAINLAERFIYIESQYFIGSGSHWNRSSVANTIPETIVNRINRHVGKSPFHAYIVMPMFPEGDPTESAPCAQRFLEFNTIQYMIQAVQTQCNSANNAESADIVSWSDYLSFYFLTQWSNQSGLVLGKDRKTQLKQNQRYMIYVHSKLMIVDDRYIILGSANLNERSLAGNRDTEICFGVWPSNDRVASNCIQQVQQYRKGIWQEHFGNSMETLVPNWQQPESAGTQFYLAAQQLYTKMRYNQRGGAGDTGHICAFPLMLDQNSNLAIDSNVYNGSDYLYIPDGVVGDNDWMWLQGGGNVAIHTDIPE